MFVMSALFTLAACVVPTEAELAELEAEALAEEEIEAEAEKEEAEADEVDPRQPGLGLSARPVDPSELMNIAGDYAEPSEA